MLTRHSEWHYSNNIAYKTEARVNCGTGEEPLQPYNAGRLLRVYASEVSLLHRQLQKEHLIFIGEKYCVRDRSK